MDQEQLKKYIILEIRIIFYSFLFLFIASCKKENPNSGLRIWNKKDCNHYGYDYDPEVGECYIPDSSFVLPPYPGIPDFELPYCFEKSPNRFYAIASDSSCCLQEGNFNMYGVTGMGEFNFETGSVYINWYTGDLYGRMVLNIFGNPFDINSKPIMENHSDGSFSVNYEGRSIESRRCNNWGKKYPECGYDFKCKTTGKSNPERTEIVLEMVWENCHNEPIDTGYIRMWREW